MTNIIYFWQDIALFIVKYKEVPFVCQGNLDYKMQFLAQMSAIRM